MRYAVALGLMAALPACDTATEAVNEASRTTAKAAVDEALVRFFPAVPKEKVTPYSNCVIDAANSNELLELSKDAVVGVDGGTVQIVRTIIARPEAVNCLIGLGLARLL